jgi:hypothetical protein
MTYSTNVVACPSVVEALAFDHQLHVELVLVRDAKEAGSKVLHGLDHPVFRLGSENWQLAGSREVVEQVCPPGSTSVQQQNGTHGHRGIETGRPAGSSAADRMGSRLPRPACRSSYSGTREVRM